MKKTGIYIHIPFCKTKCPYCDFYSFKGDEKQKDSYLSAVLSCLEGYRNDSLTVDTVYFGGGTPSVFGGKRIGRIIDYLRDNFNLESPEITVECNPSSTDKAFVGELKKSGVNRISMGMQSAVKKEREVLGRPSDKEDIRRAVTLFKDAGIDNISLDIMLGVPYQTKESLDESIDFLLESDIKHISAYMLKIEEGTPFAKMEEKLSLPDEDTVAEFYLHTVKRLTEKGFSQYEISNFALGGNESRHNLKYWHCEEYIGIGPSAHSFYKGKRFFYPREFGLFLEGVSPVADGDGGSEEEYIMLALRLKEGLSDERFRERFGKNLPAEIYKKAEKYEKMGLVCLHGDNISLTAEGFLLSNTIIGELIL